MQIHSDPAALHRSGGAGLIVTIKQYRWAIKRAVMTCSPGPRSACFAACGKQFSH